MVEFRVLGPVEMRVADKPVPLGGPRQRAVLGALLLHANAAVGVRTLLRLVWTETPSSASSNLRTYLARLRRALHLPGEPESRLRTGADGYALTVRPGELDLADFTAHAAAGERADDAEVAGTHLARALAVWRGPALADVAIGPLLDAEVTRLEARREYVRERLLRARLELGEHTELVPELRALLVHDPLAEDRAALLMLALHRCGRRAEALEVYRSTRAALVATTGIEPGPELRELHVRLLADDRVAATAPAPPPAQLPADPDLFVGRATELSDLAADHRVVVVDGMAGVGKTTLVVRAAHRLAPDHPDGLLYLDLRGSTPDTPPLTAADALARLLRSLDVPAAAIPTDTESRAALWRSTVAGKRVLVVLDDAHRADQVEPLLPGVGASRVLITCRRRLPLLGHAYPLSVDVPPRHDAATLFAAVSGRHAEPDAQVAAVVELCGRLPLAVRAAADRLRDRPTWPIGYLVGRLADERRLIAELDSCAPTLATALTTSRAALRDDQRRMLDLLGLYLGTDVRPPAVAALAETSVRTADRLLEDLVDARLLHQTAPGHYQLHALVRAYVRGRARSLDRASLRRALHRLLDHYLAQAG
ncbi:transcriptional regulator, SARP family [Alloactinosynnema sp. L-07]|nr:transcriptional regulator, SARP family [Alloactinosynnema sp. L-07]